MVTRRFDPFQDLRQMHETMNRLWQGYDNGSPEMENWAIPLDVAQEGDNIVVNAALPGVKPDDIQVSIEENTLTIRAQCKPRHNPDAYLMRECRTGNFHRSIHLPDTVDTEKASPFFENGMLTITIPKAEAKKARQLRVQHA